MPKKCRALYLNFIKLQKETKNLKNNLTHIKNKKETKILDVVKKSN